MKVYKNDVDRDTAVSVAAVDVVCMMLDNIAVQLGVAVSGTITHTLTYI